jgi:hypothetical protein
MESGFRTEALLITFGPATTFHGTTTLSFVIPSKRLACGKLRVK